MKLLSRLFGPLGRHPQAPMDECGQRFAPDGSTWCAEPLNHLGPHTDNYYLWDGDGA